MTGRNEKGSEDGLNQVHMSPKRACHRLAMVYLACIHMQIPIDMTTFTYCIFALGHILARQFPIVGFRPPVRLIDIIGRAADTRLHFYLHTFADQFDPLPPRETHHCFIPWTVYFFPFFLLFFRFLFFFFLHIAITARAWRFRGEEPTLVWLTAAIALSRASCKNGDCLEIYTQRRGGGRGDEVVSNCWITIYAEGARKGDV